MGLAERKFKQRIGVDPRNLTWSNDQDRFSYKHMKQLGWSDASGLGAGLAGNPNNIAVARKLDNGGIGMGRARKEGDDSAAGAGQAGRGLEDVLKRLQAASESPSPSPAPVEQAEKEKSAPIRNRIASRQRHLHSKRLASQSPAALAEILGVPVSSLPSSTLASLTPTPIASGSSTPISESPAEPVAAPEETDDSTADESVMTSKLSVADYFRMKMREKMLARQKGSAGSATTPGSSTSLAVFKEEVKVEVGGAAWEGSRTTFVEETPVASTSTAETDEKEAKRRQKEERRAKTALANGTPVASTSTAEADEKEAKRRRKEEKRAKKAGKAALALTAAKPVQEIKSEKKKKRAREDDAATPGSNAGAEERSRKRKEGEATAETDGRAVGSGNDGGDSASGVDKPKKRRKDKS